MASEPPLAATISNLKELAARLQATNLEIDDLTKKLDEAKKVRSYLRTVEIPRIMQELGINSIGVGNHTLTLDTLIEATLPKDPDKRLKAINWLNDHGHAGTLRRILSLELPRDNDAIVQQASDMLEGLSLHPTVDYSIHYQTYLALIREIVRSGAPAPLEDLGAFVGKIAKVE